jgi:hypothetical protein
MYQQVGRMVNPRSLASWKASSASSFPTPRPSRLPGTFVEYMSIVLLQVPSKRREINVENAK